MIIPEFTVYGGDMRLALTKLLNCAGIAFKRKDNPLSGAIYFKADANGLLLKAQCAEFAVEKRLAAHVTQSGEGCIRYNSAVILANAFEGDDAQTFTFTADEYDLTVYSGDEKLMTMPFDDCKDYFDAPAATGELPTLFTLAQDELKDLLKRTLNATSNDSYRHELQTVNFKCTGKVLTLAATDTRRLATATIDKLTYSSADDFNICISDVTLRFLLSLLKSRGEVKISFKKRSARIAVDSWVIRTRLVEVQFPDYSKLVPADDFIAPVEITILDTDKKTGVKILRDAIKFCQPATDELGTLTITAGNTAIEIVAKNYECTARVLVPARIDGAENGSAVFNVNCKALLDALSALSDSIVTIELTAEYIMIREGDSLALMTPIRKDDITISLPEPVKNTFDDDTATDAEFIDTTEQVTVGAA